MMSDDEDHEKDRSEAPMVGEHAAEKLVGPADSAADRRHESQRGTKLFGRQNIAENQVGNLKHRAGRALQKTPAHRELQHWARASRQRFPRTLQPASKSEFFCVPAWSLYRVRTIPAIPPTRKNNVCEMPTSAGVEASLRAISGTAGATIDAFNWKAITPRSSAVSVADFLVAFAGKLHLVCPRPIYRRL